MQIGRDIDVKRAWARMVDELPPVANTSKSSASRSNLPMYSPTPERWATLAQAACKARSSGDGYERIEESVEANVTS
jgi:hypothetical protein